MDKFDLTLHTLLKKASKKVPDPMPKDVSDAVLHTLTSLPDTPPVFDKRNTSKVYKIIAAAAAAAAAAEFPTPWKISLLLALW